MNLSGEIMGLIEGRYDSKYPRAGREVSGLKVGDDIANMSSIGSSLSDWKELPGIREVRFKLFKDMPSVVNTQRVRDLADAIKASGQIDPLIIVEDGHKDGPYVLEGSHRWDALRILKVSSFPALVVLDLESVEERHTRPPPPPTKIEPWKNYKHVRIRQQANDMVAKGLLKPQPCQASKHIKGAKCTVGPDKTHKHHLAYDRPDNVAWLCNPHHRELHRSIGKMPVEACTRSDMNQSQQIATALNELRDLRVGDKVKIDKAAAAKMSASDWNANNIRLAKKFAEWGTTMTVTKFLDGGAVEVEGDSNSNLKGSNRPFMRKVTVHQEDLVAA